MSPEFLEAVVQAVIDHDSWGTTTDPYGLHEAGLVVHMDVTVLWRIVVAREETEDPSPFETRATLLIVHSADVSI